MKTVIACALVGVLVVVAAAGPLLPEARQMPDEVLSVAELKQVTIEVSPLQSELKVLGANKALAEQTFTEELREIGLEVLEEQSTHIPHLVLTVRAKTDPKQPEAISIVTFLATEQEVDLKRLDRTFKLPTNVVVDVFLTTVGEANREVVNRVRHTVQLLERAVRHGTTALRGARSE